jgi:hypothetical protein
MGIHYDFSFDFIAMVTGFLAWCVIGIIAYRMYKKQAVKPKVWKVFVSILVGIFSFSINLNWFDTLVKLSILPLGVWILYWHLKGKEGRWQTYRPFAWLGFFANYIFLAATLLAIPTHHLVYPENELSTYLSNTENASIINTHSSALDRSLNKESLLKQIHNMKQEPIYSEEWYEKTYMEPDIKKINERFPYQLTEISSKWGSGLETIIFVEADGKGMLVTTPKKQLYFRSVESLLKGGN